MKLKPTTLNIPAALFVLGCIIYTIINYETLSYAEEWGVVFMIGIIGFGLTAFEADLIIHNVIKNPKTQLVVRLLVLIGYIVFFIVGMEPEYA